MLLSRELNLLIGKLVSADIPFATDGDSVEVIYRGVLHARVECTGRRLEVNIFNKVIDGVRADEAFSLICDQLEGDTDLLFRGGRCYG